MTLHLYKINLPTEVPPVFLQLLSKEERAFAQTIRNEMIRKRHLVVRVAVRKILATYLNQTAPKINIVKNDYGKPYLADYPDCQFNISHSGNTLFMALSTLGEVGVDIEQAKPQNRDFSGLVAKCFAASEILYWNTLSDAEKRTEFYRFWTRKEAFVKAVGRGLAIGLPQCVIESKPQLRFIKLPESVDAPANWRLFDLPLKADLYGALVLHNSNLAADFVLPKITLFEIGA